MSELPLHVIILWHMHQPYYKDVNRQEYLMPWVGLHATKDYLDMPLLAGEYDGLQVTFNMVPSLLEQVQEYAAGTANDPYLRLARMKPEDMEEGDRLALLQMFFAAHYENMIKPFSRYRQLHERRGWSNNLNDLRRRLPLFSPSDLRDLQVWFYLTWIDPWLREQNPRLKNLVERERMFSEQDKQDVLRIAQELTGRIVPALSELWAAGRIEVSTTPYFHPILPLLVDTEIARRSRPTVHLPSRRFHHPEDAQLQIERGLEYCQKLFGRRPAGMWPSEGSVCPEVIPLFQRAGVRWIASDEDVLAHSLGIERFTRDRNGLVDNADALYRPYIVSHDGAQTAIFLRDHFLSDQIGFKYMHWEPQAAAADLIRRLEEIHYKLGGSPDPHVVSIILDGENCWEHYTGDGEPFLRAFYKALSTHRHLKSVTPSSYLDLFPEQRRLERLHSGSWINHDFSIWIGHPEDNASWDLLVQTRDDMQSRLAATPDSESQDSVARQNALKSLLIAEGSDWNWWYGDDHTSDFDDQFDALYRQHLSNVYQALGMKIPARLFIPISSQSDAGLQTIPCAFITPRIDGRATNFFEWYSAGHYNPRRGGSMHQSDTGHVIDDVYFGFNQANFYLRLDLSAQFRKSKSIGEAELIIYLFLAQNLKIVCPLARKIDHSACGRVFREVEGQGWVDEGQFDSFAVGQIVEFAFAFDRFQMGPNQILRFQTAVEVGYHEIERCPDRGPLAVNIPNERFEETMWIV